MPQPTARHRQQDQTSVAAHSPRSRYSPHRPWLFLVREAAPVEDPYGSGNVDGNVDEAHPAPVPEYVRAPGPDLGAAPSRDLERAAHASLGAAPVPDPFTDADALEALEEEITVLAAHIHAATYRFLSLIAEFDRRRGWELGGHRSCAHWLSFRTGIDLGAAREKVRAARALEGLPETSASMARGELSFSKVRALSVVGSQTGELG